MEQVGYIVFSQRKKRFVISPAAAAAAAEEELLSTASVARRRRRRRRQWQPAATTRRVAKTRRHDQLLFALRLQGTVFFVVVGCSLLSREKGNFSLFVFIYLLFTKLFFVSLLLRSSPGHDVNIIKEQEAKQLTVIFYCSCTNDGCECAKNSRCIHITSRHKFEFGLPFGDKMTQTHQPHFVN